MPDARTKYRDIIDRPHHVSAKRPQMSRLNRAAQFAPFAALTGYDDLIHESARETEARRVPNEDRIEEMNDKLVFLFRQKETPEATFTVFVPDRKKAGGRHIAVTGKVMRYDEYEQSITLQSGEVIFIEDITQIYCNAFDAAHELWTPDENLSGAQHTRECVP